MPLVCDSKHSPRSPAPKGTKRAAVIGGRQLVRDAMVKMLHSHHLSVRFAWKSAIEMRKAATESLRPVHFFTVICDTSVDLLKQVSKIICNRGLNHPVVLVLGDCDPSNLYEAIRLGVKGIITFEDSSKDFARVVRTVVRGGVCISGGASTMLTESIVAKRPKAHRPQITLSSRETEVVRLLCMGLSSKEAARRLFISAKTVENHRNSIYRKWQVNNIACLIRRALLNGLVRF